jgi:hypothetical protein
LFEGQVNGMRVALPWRLGHLEYLAMRWLRALNESVDEAVLRFK